MIYSPELARFLAPYVQRIVGVVKRHPWLPLKVGAIALALATVPVLTVVNPVAGTAVAASTIPAAIATAEEVQKAAAELSPEGVATLGSATERVVRELDRVVKEGGVLMTVEKPTPAPPPTKGLANALDRVETK
jgi:hypothetical protein